MTETKLRISFEEYREIDRMNASTLAKGKKSMLALKNAMDGKAEEKSDALQFGNKYHSMILEPEKFERVFCVMPNFAAMEQNCDKKGNQSESWATTFCKESKWHFEQQAGMKKMEVITREEYDTGLSMVESVNANKFAGSLLSMSEKEVTLLGEIDQVPFKCRLDLCNPGFIADIKGCGSAAANAFGKSAAEYGYSFQLAIYREIWQQNFQGEPDVFLIAIEKGGDFDCCVYEVPEAAMDHSRKEVSRILADMKKCQATGVWPGVDRGESPLPLYVPNWAMPDDDDLEWD